MIRLKEIELKNFLRHKHFKHVFDGSNVLMLTGENGSGKTTIQTAVRFAIRGVIESVEKKAPNARAIHRPAKSATVKLTFESDGSIGVITRSLTLSGGSSRELLWDGKAYTKDVDVDEVMSQIFGADLKAVENLVFIPQGALEMLFAGTPGERHELWAKLTSISGTDKVVSVVDSAVRRLSAGISDYTVALQTAEDMIHTRQRDLEQANQVLDAFPDGPALDASLARVRKLRTAWESKEEAVAACERLTAMTGVAAAPSEAELAAVRADIDLDVASVAASAETRNRNSQMRFRKQTLETELTNAVAAASTGTALSQAKEELQDVVGAEPAAMVSEYHLNDLLRVPDTVTELSEVTSQLATVSAELSATDVPLAAAQARTSELSVALDNVNKARNTAVTDLRTSSDLLAAVSGASGCNCPVCGQTVADGVLSYLNSQVDTLRTAAEKLGAEEKVAADTWHVSVNDVEAISRNRSSLSGKISSLIDRKSKLGVFLATMPAPEMCSTEVERLQDKSKDLAVWNERMAAAKAKLFRSQSDHNVYDGMQLREESAIRADLQPLSVLVPLLPEDSVLAAAGAEINARLTDLKNKLATMLSQVSALAGAKQQHEQARQRLEAAAATISDLVAECDGNLAYDELVVNGLTTFDRIEATTGLLTGRLEGYRCAVNSLEVAQRTLAAMTESRDAIVVKMEAQRQKQELIADLKQVSAAFQPSGAPGDYLAHEFGRLAIDVQDYLAETGAAFTVMASDSSPLSFDFLKLGEPDAEWLPQSQFSGGQRVTLSLGVIHACHKLFIPSVGLMCLDEPSLHLSGNAKENLAEWIRGIENSGELQLIVCDHTPEIVNAAGQLVTFD